MSRESLLEASQTLLQAVTADELEDLIPKAFASALPPRSWCLFLRDSSERESTNRDGRQVLCIPLREAGHVLGTVLICSSVSMFELNARQEADLGEIARLAGVALASRIESDLAREQARAEAAEVRFDMIGMLAHEMRTPLASIKGYASALLLEELELDSDTLREFLQAIDEESDRLNQMVTHLLDSTVIEAGALELQREPVSMPPLIRKTTDTMSRRTDRHRIITSFTDDLVPVFADEDRVQQVLINLIDNAIKYSPDGGLIVVRCRRINDELLVQVSDQGIGIAPEHLNKLFERFFRTEQRRALGVSGTGLGLPIADALVRAHGGRIWAESTVDHGTTLSFTLPIIRESGVSRHED